MLSKPTPTIHIYARYLCYVFIGLFTMPAVTYSAAREYKVSLTENPLPVDTILCSYDVAIDRYHYNGIKLLTRPEVYIGDALRMAKLYRLTEKLVPLYSPTDLAKDINDPEELRNIACYLADCSSQLGDYFLNKYKDSAGMSFEEQDAFMQLLNASKTAIAARKQSSSIFYLDECQDLRCPTASYRYPNTRPTITKLIVDHMETSPLTCCFFASGSLAREYKILEAMARNEKAPNVLVLIDRKYTHLIKMHDRHKSCIEYTRNSDNVKPNYKNYFAELMDNERRFATSSFVVILQAYSARQTLHQFKRLAHSICPNLAQITIYGDVWQYSKQCKQDPVFKSQLLIGCDFKDATAKDLNGIWCHLLTCYNELQHNCLEKTAQAWSLTTVGPDSARLTMQKQLRIIKEWCWDALDTKKTCPEYKSYSAPQEFLF